MLNLKEDLEAIAEIRKDLRDLKEISKLVGQDESLERELGEKLEVFEKKLKKQEIKGFLSGRYDKNNVILSIYAGAGGQDAQDWATMLLRMYERYCQRKKFKTGILAQSFGESGGPEGRIGTKSAVLEVQGHFAYGFLKRETGVHRLVRISPFSAKNLRHTSFALVEVLPELSEKEKQEIEIRQEDIKLEMFRSSGPGGQHVNKRETAVRITHLPTKIIVSCQSERFQGLNREKAMKILYAKLFQLKQIEKQKEIAQIKQGNISASWGNQIRSYVLHPYKLVKDLRTDIETSNVEAVLDGDLDKFIEAEIRIND